jgi:hypothetical protein
MNYRKHKRHDTFWTVSKADIKDNQEKVIGYLLNFSKDGIELWVDKNDTVEDLFHIRIYPPVKVDSDSIEFDVECKWKKSNEDSLFYQVGCQFKNLTSEKQKELEKLSLMDSKDMVFPLIEEEITKD